MRTRVQKLLKITIVLMLLLCISSVYAQDAAQPTEPTPPAATAPEATAVPIPQPAEQVAAVVPAPTITPDTEIFKRTPVIDGAVEEGEWDGYYTFTAGDWTINTYADWDPNYLYVAAKSNKPIDLLVLLDADANGWFHGEDNYEFRAVRSGEGALTLSVNRYESKNSKSATATPVTPEEAALVEVRSTKADSGFAIEMRIPESMVRGFKLSDQKTMGLQIAVRDTQDDASWIPSTVMGNSKDCRECVLVAKKIAALKPLVLGFDLRETRIARGEELVGKFHIADEGAETVDVRSFIIAGEGKSGDYLSSQKVRMEGLASKKHVAHEVRSIIPSNMPLGSWALGAEVRSNDARLGGALISFEVVDPYEIALKLPTKDVRADVKDVTFGIAVTNNMRRSIRGSAKITLPLGWELWKNADLREFSVSGGSISSVTFKAKPPLGVLGSVPVKIEVNVNGEIKSAEGTFNIVNPPQ